MTLLIVAILGTEGSNLKLPKVEQNNNLPNQKIGRDGLLNSNYKREEYRPFPDLSPAHNPPADDKPRFPVHPQTPYSPPKALNYLYEPLTAIYPNPYYTESPYYQTTSISPTHHFNGQYSHATPGYHSHKYYGDLKKVPENYNLPLSGFNNNANDFPKFNDYLKQSSDLKPVRP
jgi:hypothetical protein